MIVNYINRRLILNRGQKNEALIDEAEIATIGTPIVILGDPGLGKTELTKRLANQLSYTRVTAGTFYRNQERERFRIQSPAKLVIDGLDEIASSSQKPPIDEVLSKLSEIGNPNFIISCRSADWQGSTDRYKIGEDYGTEPTTLHLQPFSYDDAKAFLENYDSEIQAESILLELNNRDLSDFYGNPLTLTLVAEVASAGQGLPKGQAGLLSKATELLAVERNRAHQRSSTAQSSLDELLDAAGAIFAHLLLSSSMGVTDRPRAETPRGFIPISDLLDITGPCNARSIVKTRLFQSFDENVYGPFHKVIAEFLGARWLSKQLSQGISERRIFQLLSFSGGIPTPLRGIHAWIAHFSPTQAHRCIKADPYGVLRYGDMDSLSTDVARLLLNSLSSLANEDPYFRSEDWGKRQISGIARGELESDIVALIGSPQRHVHLSTLILEALEGSKLTSTISGKLLTIVKDCSAPYIERAHALEALIASHISVDWPDCAEELRQRKKSGDSRLVLEIIAATKGENFDGNRVATAILDYRKPSRQPVSSIESDEALDDDDNQDDPYVSGMVYAITQRISPEKAGEVLDALKIQIAALKKPTHWRPGYELSNSVEQLIDKAIETASSLESNRIWDWLKLADRETGHSSDRDNIQNWLEENSTVRREIQQIAFTEGDPWMAIVHELPRASRGLALTEDDFVAFLNEISCKDELTTSEVERWAALFQAQRNTGIVSAAVDQASEAGRSRHKALEREWRRISTPPKRDFRKEQEERKIERERKRERTYAKHRASYWAIREQIANGEAVSALSQIAEAYLGRYSDLNNETVPIERVSQWLGNEIKDAAIEGFIAVLSKEDIPTVEKISKTHSEQKRLCIELAMICGVLELSRSGKGFSSVKKETLAACLAAWWEFSSFHTDHFGNSVRDEVENIVLSSMSELENFLTAMATPHIRAGRQHVPIIHRIAREKRFEPVAGKIALSWLIAHPNANAAVQHDLLQICFSKNDLSAVKRVIDDRTSKIELMDEDLKRVWISANVYAEMTDYKELVSKFSKIDKSLIWNLRDTLQPDRNKRTRASRPLSIIQLEAIVDSFASLWPPVSHPSSSWGDTNTWNATEFLRQCINALGAFPTEDASASLDRLLTSPNTLPYQDQIKHVRAQQLRLRRDTEYRVPTFYKVKEVLANNLPASIEDLQALTLDKLDEIRDYIRNGDTDAWDAFWNENNPKNENTCRHRLLDLLRSKLNSNIHFLPETLMPEAKRADIVVLHGKFGFPIEIKGQWHPEVWNAATVQLIQQYARDWRADDHGIYLVFWFGSVAGKNLPAHPDGLPRPSSPEELERVLKDRLPDIEKGRIAVVVIDVSKPVKR